MKTVSIVFVLLMIGCDSAVTDPVPMLEQKVATSSQDATILSVEEEEAVLQEDAAAILPRPKEAPNQLSLSTLACKLGPYDAQTRFDYPILCSTDANLSNLGFTYNRNGQTGLAVTAQKLDVAGSSWQFVLPIQFDDKDMVVTVKDELSGKSLQAVLEPTLLRARRDMLSVPPIAASAKTFKLIASDRGDTCLGQSVPPVPGASKTIGLVPCNLSTKAYTWKLTTAPDHSKIIEFLNNDSGVIGPECLDVRRDLFVVGTALLRYACHFTDAAYFATSFNQDFNFVMKSPTEFLIQSAPSSNLCLGLSAAVVDPQVELVDCSVGKPLIFRSFENRPTL